MLLGLNSLASQVSLIILATASPTSLAKISLAVFSLPGHFLWPFYAKSPQADFHLGEHNLWPRKQESTCSQNSQQKETQISNTYSSSSTPSTSLWQQNHYRRAPHCQTSRVKSKKPQRIVRRYCRNPRGDFPRCCS